MKKLGKEKMKKILAMLICMVLMLGTVGCGTTGGNEGAASAGIKENEEAAPAGTEEKTIVIAATAAWTSENIFMAMNGNTVSTHFLIWEPLFNYTMRGELVGFVAESYEVNEEKTEYTVKIRDNLFFSDGEQLTADDVVYTYELNASAELASNRHSMLTTLVGTDDTTGTLVEGEELGIEKIDDLTVKFTLKQPTEEFTFLANQRNYLIVPEHVVSNYEIAELENLNFYENIPGSGQLIFESQIEGERMELRANTNYARGELQFDRVVIKVVPTTNMLSTFMADEADVCFLAGSSSLPMVDLEMARAQENFTVEEVASLGAVELTLNNQDEDLSDVNIRRAIAYAIDRQKLIDVLLNGMGSMAYSPYSQNHEYFCEEIDYISYDPEMATQLLDEAGWDYSRVLTLAVPSNNTERQDIAALIQQMLGEVGVQIEVVNCDTATLFSSLSSGEYDMGLCSTGGSPIVSDFAVCYQPGNGVCFSNVADDSMYELFIAAGAAVSKEERTALTKEIQERINDECHYVFLYSANLISPISNRIQGVNYENFTTYLYDMTTWTVTE